MTTAAARQKKEKVYQQTLLNEQKDFDSALKNFAGMKLVTVATVSDKYKCGLSVARKLIHEAVKQGLVKPVYNNHLCNVWTSTIEKKTEVAQEQKKQGKGKGKN